MEALAIPCSLLTPVELCRSALQMKNSIVLRFVYKVQLIMEKVWKSSVFNFLFNAALRLGLGLSNEVQMHVRV